MERFTNTHPQLTSTKQGDLETDSCSRFGYIIHFLCFLQRRISVLLEDVFDLPPTSAIFHLLVVGTRRDAYPGNSLRPLSLATWKLRGAHPQRHAQSS